MNFLFNIPPVTRYILILNIIVFVVVRYILPIELSIYFPLWYFMTDLFKPHQIFTSMFHHANWIHLAANMFAFISFGSMLERVWGGNKFFLFYIISGIGSALMVMGVAYIQVNFFGFYEYCEYSDYHCIHPVVGASGAIFGIFAGFALLAPDAPLQIMFIPVNFRAINILYFSLFFSLIGVLGFIPIGLSHEGHLGGILAGMALFKTSVIDKFVR